MLQNYGRTHRQNYKYRYFKISLSQAPHRALVGAKNVCKHLSYLQEGKNMLFLEEGGLMTGSGHGVTEVLGVMRTLLMRNARIGSRSQYGEGRTKNGQELIPLRITTIFVNTLYKYFVHSPHYLTSINLPQPTYKKNDSSNDEWWKENQEILFRNICIIIHQ